jgi:hypothetical protein
MHDAGAFFGGNEVPWDDAPSIAFGLNVGEERLVAAPDELLPPKVSAERDKADAPAVSLSRWGPWGGFLPRH